jgi:hypothetical protein
MSASQTSKATKLTFGEPTVEDLLRTVWRDLQATEARKHRAIAAALHDFIVELRVLDVQLCCLRAAPLLHASLPSRLLIPRWAGWTLLLCGVITVLKAADTGISGVAADRLGSIACDLCALHDPNAEVDFALWHAKAELHGWPKTLTTASPA